MIGVHWYAVKDGFIPARGLFDRHYSRHHYKDGRPQKLFVGPGEKMVLMTTDGRALFAWRKCGITKSKKLIILEKGAG